MNSVVDWFASIGLAQYAQRFVENDVDLGVLAGLTENDLKELGVSSFGHRRKILAAIGELRGPVVANAQPTVSAVPVPRDAAERRQLSVMFCDLVDSTALSARLDPEEMGKVIAAYQAACSPIIADYDGLVAKFMGDGILAYFGYPRAHEDDAERAVRAALDIIAAVAHIKTAKDVSLGVRIGIATGLVVVGDLIGEGVAQERAVVGDAPNLAARLQSLAEPGMIIVAPSTRRLLGSVFELRSLGRLALKGFLNPVEGWVVAGHSNSENRFEAAHSQQLTNFVGREEESALLVERLDLAWSGEGQVVLISGEAGIGKSRVAAWLAEHVAQKAHTRVRYQCSPYHRESSLYPVIRQIERTANIQIDETPEEKLSKLEGSLVLAAGRAREIAPLFASLLSIPFATRYASLSLSPAQQRRRTLEALLEQLEGLARQNPVLMLFEDAHWADATSLELIDLAVERVRQLPVLFLITFRPEFEPPWEGLRNVTSVRLGRLDGSQVEAIVANMTGGRQLPAEVMSQIIAKTDGVPLFVEELTKTIQESGLLVADGGRYRLERPFPELAIPSTLHDSLMARLDRLSPPKEVVQTGAAIGREFSYSVLQAVIGRDQAVLAPALAQLEEAQLVFRTGFGTDARYTFKHALMQDAAYESLLKSRRQVLHLRIAKVLCDRFAGMAAAQPEIVANHFTQAGAVEDAIEWWNKAGDLALRRAAFAEATVHLRRAIDLADQPQPEGGAVAPIARRLRLQIAYAQALVQNAGWTVPETTAAFARAREMATGIEDRAERLAVYFGLWGGCYTRGELAATREIADAFMRDATQSPNLPEEGVAHRMSGGGCWFAGEYVAARQHFERTVAIYDEHRDAQLAHIYGQDVGVSGMVRLALTLWPLGEIDRAAQLADDSISLAKRCAHVPSMAYARFHLALLDYIRGDVTSCAVHADVLFELCREYALGIWMPAGVFVHGWSQWQGGEKVFGFAEMQRGLAMYRELGVGVYLPFLGMALAEAEANSAGPSVGVARIEETLAESERSGQHWLDAELHRLRGDFLLRCEPVERNAADAAYRSAIAIAERQGTRSFVLRASLRLARLLRESDAAADLSELLNPALVGFAPSPQFPDVTEARALL